MIAAIAGGAVLALAVVGYLVFLRDDSGSGSQEADAAPVADSAAPAEPAPVESAPVAEAGPTPEEIQAQIAKMVEEQSKQLEAGLKQKYDEQLRTLQKQLESSRVTEETRPRPPEAAPRPAATPPAAPTEPPAAKPQEGAGRPAVTPPATAPAGTTTKPVEPETGAPEPAVGSPTPPASAKPEPPPEEPAVKLGDLVKLGPGVVPPRIVRQPALQYPPVAQRMRKEATVTVSVLIDHNGRAADVKQISSKVGFGLDEAAADYAREITWAPATKDGVKVKMWYDLRVAFSLSGR